MRVSKTFLSLSSVAVAAVSALALSACQETTQVVQQAAIPNYGEPEFSRALESHASAYVTFRQDIGVAASTSPSRASDITNVHHLLASHDSDMMTTGLLSYAALVAADNPTFAQGLRDQINSQGRDAVVHQLRNDSFAAMNMPGANEAMQQVAQTLAADSAYVDSVGQLYIDTAYKIQNKSWGRRKINTNGSARVEAAKSYAHSRSMVATPDIASDGMMKTPALASIGHTWSPEWSGQASYASSNNNSANLYANVLMLAARYSIGDLNDQAVGVYASDRMSRSCINTAKLNLAQCIAASRSAYEESYCLGEHGLKEVSTCLGKPTSMGSNYAAR